MLFTGNADAWYARCAKGLWYYLHCVGHVTVLSRDGLQGMLRDAGFGGVEVHRADHESSVSFAAWWGRYFTNGVRKRLGRIPAPLHYYHDHQLGLAWKPSS